MGRVPRKMQRTWKGEKTSYQVERRKWGARTSFPWKTIGESCPRKKIRKLDDRDELYLRTVFKHRSGNLTREEINKLANEDIRLGNIIEKIRKIKAKSKATIPLEQRVFDHIRELVYKT